MKNRKLTLIIICALLVLGGILFFYGFKDMFAVKNKVIDYTTYGNEIEKEPVISVGNIDAGEDSDINPSPAEKNNDSMADIISPAADSMEETTSQAPDSKDNKNSGESNNGEEKNDEESEPPNNNTNETNKQEKGDTINILFLGIDRTAARHERNLSFSSDAIMLASIDMTNKKADILSIPRDSYVHIPTVDKKDKIAYSYAYGYIKGNAAKSTIDTINYLTGNKVVDYYFAMDMEPIPRIVDELGGIEINTDNGQQILNGENTLGYIRWRNSEDGDIGRIKRHHAILRAMFGKIASYDKEKLVELFVSNEQHINTDMGLEQILNLANIVAEFDNEDINFIILPGNPQTIDNISYWIIDEDKAKELIGGIF